MADRERVGRDASPAAAIIDSQSVKTTEAGGPRGYDAGKKINGRKRHALVDTDGRGLVLEPHPASIQDRDGGGPLLRFSRRIFPFVQRVFADSGYAGEKVTTATLIAVEIVRKNPDQVGFAINPRRWVVERFFAWIGRNRRLAKDFEATIDSARAFLYAASVMLLVRRIARASRLSKPTLRDPPDRFGASFVWLRTQPSLVTPASEIMVEMVLFGLSPVWEHRPGQSLLSRTRKA